MRASLTGQELTQILVAVLGVNDEPRVASERRRDMLRRGIGEEDRYEFVAGRAGIVEVLADDPRFPSNAQALAAFLVMAGVAVVGLGADHQYEIGVSDLPLAP